MLSWRPGRPFRDRREAGKVLAAKLAALPLRDPVVLALPRGGVVVGAEIAEALCAPLDLLLVRKLGVPDQPELAMGAVGEGEEALVLNPDVIRLAGVSEREIAEAVARERAEIVRRREAYLAGRARVPVSGRSAIVVDDGIATGATMRAGLAVLRRAAPHEIVVAVPVAPPDTVRVLEGEADRVVVAQVSSLPFGIGGHYDDFHQLADEEVVAILDRFAPPR